MGAALPRQNPSQHPRRPIHLAEALQAIGVTIQYAELASDTAAEWNGYTRTATIRGDVHPLNQAWLLKQVLTLLLLGPAATPAACHERRLILVPPLPRNP
jgi:hypothetical protein